jgi:4-hydroxysphinganine ceramide fatty acyl 2-hydroxylase
MAPQLIDVDRLIAEGVPTHLCGWGADPRAIANAPRKMRARQKRAGRSVMTDAPIALLLGAFTWSFLEYCIHRWLGHDRRFRPNFFATEHVRHHIEGDYFAPAKKKALAAMVMLIVVGGPAMWIAGPAAGGAWISGLVGFYLFYEVLHRREHTHAGVGPYGRWARRHHFYHHFVDARVNHGVTSPIWDLVFGTYRMPDTITVPPRLMMPWLGTRETGIKPEHRAHYALKGAAEHTPSRGGREARPA